MLDVNSNVEVRPDEGNPLRLRKPPSVSNATVPESLKHLQQPVGDSSGQSENRVRPRVKKRKNKSGVYWHFIRIFPWLLFFVLGGFMGLLRYGQVMDAPPEMALYGPYVILALHLVIVVVAFRNDIFMGFLCLLVPGYSLYYLLAQSGQRVLTALVCGLLVGLGEDSFYALSEWSQDMREHLDGLIAGGGR